MTYADIGALLMVMSQSKVQKLAVIAVMKMAMDNGKKSTAKIFRLMFGELLELT